MRHIVLAAAIVLAVVFALMGGLRPAYAPLVTVVDPPAPPTCTHNISADVCDPTY